MGETHQLPVGEDRPKLPLVMRDVQFVPEIDPTVIYGIWSTDLLHWLVDGNGQVIHTPYLRVAMAYLVTAVDHLKVRGHWIAVKIGIDGLPDKEAMRALGLG
jgi:hypothetical protein